MKEQPSVILESGTKVRTDKTLTSNPRMMIKPQYLDNRRANALGTLKGIVGSHGGDVYWVEHEDETIAAYCWSEFELILRLRSDPSPPATRFERADPVGGDP